MMGPTPRVLAHWMPKKVQNNKKSKNAIPGLLLSYNNKHESERWAKLWFWPVQTSASRLGAPA